MNRKPSISYYKARECWQVDIPPSVAGKRLRRFFPSREMAEVFAADTMREVRAVGLQAFESGITVTQAAKRMLDRMGEKSERHQETAKHKFGKFCAAFGKRDLARVSPSDLDAWLMAIPNPTTRAGYFRYLKMLFRWAHRMELIPRNPILAIDPPESRPCRNIWTPEMMKDVLALDLPGWMRAAVLLQGFAGLRTAELCRMDWSAVDLEAGQIHVGQGVQKDSGGWSERYVDLTEPLQKRKKDLTGKGMIVPMKASAMCSARRLQIAVPMQWQKWPENALRHSFATYHLARGGDSGKTAFQMGHSSPAMVNRFYAMPAKRADWEQWWTI